MRKWIIGMVLILLGGVSIHMGMDSMSEDMPMVISSIFFATGIGLVIAGAYAIFAVTRID